MWAPAEASSVAVESSCCAVTSAPDWISELAAAVSVGGSYHVFVTVTLTIALGFTVCTPSCVSSACRARSHCSVQPDPLTGSTQMKATFSLVLPVAVVLLPHAPTTKATARDRATILANLMLTSLPLIHANPMRASDLILSTLQWGCKAQGSLDARDPLEFQSHR